MDLASALSKQRTFVYIFPYWTYLLLDLARAQVTGSDQPTCCWIWRAPRWPAATNVPVARSGERPGDRQWEKSAPQQGDYVTEKKNYIFVRGSKRYFTFLSKVTRNFVFFRKIFPNQIFNNFAKKPICPYVIHLANYNLPEYVFMHVYFFFH